MLSVLQILKPPRSKVKLEEQIIFLDRLAKLMDKQFTLKRSLELMTYDLKFSDLANQFLALLHDGHSVDHCLRLLHFETTVSAYMYFTKEAGQLVKQLNNCLTLLKMKRDFLKKLKEVSRYPVILFAICVFLFLFLSSYFIPLYTNTLKQMNIHENLQIIVFIDSLFKGLIITVLSLLLIILFIYRFYFSKLTIDKQISVINKLPIVSSIYRHLTSMQFAYHISSILQSGRTIKETLSIVQQQNDLKIIQYYATQIKKKLSEGQSFYKSIEDLSLLEQELKMLIYRSDRDGTLLKDLQAYSELLLDHLDSKVKKILFIIQPTLYSIIGALIIIIYFFALYPMYQLLQHI